LHEYSQLAFLPILALCQQIRQQEGKSTIIVHPPHINESVLVSLVKHVYTLKNALINFRVLQSDQLCAFKESRVYVSQRFLALKVALMLRIRYAYLSCYQTLDVMAQNGRFSVIETFDWDFALIFRIRLRQFFEFNQLIRFK